MSRLAPTNTAALLAITAGRDRGIVDELPSRHASPEHLIDLRNHPIREPHTTPPTRDVAITARTRRPSCGTPPCRGGIRRWPAVARVRTSFNHPDAGSSTPPWGRERFDLQERVQALFRMESLRGSISRSFALARQTRSGSLLSDLEARLSCHPPADRRHIELTTLSLIGLTGLERP